MDSAGQSNSRYDFLASPLDSLVLVARVDEDGVDDEEEEEEEDVEDDDGDPSTPASPRFVHSSRSISPLQRKHQFHSSMTV
ncbi:hypothetical protein FRC17_006396, partial [Serendipita sp. 399]